jgi:hypothetical protein
MPTGVDARWQFSHAVLDGMCEFTPTGVVGGIPTIFVMPAKVELTLLGTWQATQLLAMPVWFISEPMNLAPLTTGSVGTLEPEPT